MSYNFQFKLDAKILARAKKLKAENKIKHVSGF